MEKEEAATALEDIAGVDVVDGRRGRAEAGLRHSRFAVRPASRWRVAIMRVNVEWRGCEAEGEVGGNGSYRVSRFRPLLRSQLAAGRWRQASE